MEIRSEHAAILWELASHPRRPVPVLTLPRPLGTQTERPPRMQLPVELFSFQGLCSLCLKNNSIEAVAHFELAAASSSLRSMASSCSREKYLPASTTARIFWVFRMSSRGLASSTTKSASFPLSTDPKSEVFPRNTAGLRVAVCSASNGVSP